MKTLKSIDIFGHPVGVLYKGQSEHKTLLGSLLSLVKIVAVMIFAVKNLIDTTSHNNQDETERRIFTDIDEAGPISLEENKFTLMF